MVAKTTSTTYEPYDSTKDFYQGECAHCYPSGTAYVDGIFVTVEGSQVFEARGIANANQVALRKGVKTDPDAGIKYVVER